MLVTSVVDLAWAGDTLFVTLLDRSDPHTLRSDLHRWAGGRWERLTHGARLTEIAPSPGGVVAVRLGGGTSALVRWTSEGLVTVAEGADGMEWTSPTWAAGRLFAIRRIGGASSVVRLDRDGGGDPVVMPVPGGLSADLRWAAGRLLFANDATGVPSVVALDPATGALSRLVSPATGAIEPTGNAEWLYYVTLEADGYALRRRRWVDLTPESVAPLEQAHEPVSPTPPATVLGDGSYRPWSALRPHYWLPDVRGRGAAGTFVGAATAGSDPLERLSYGARAAVGLSGRRVELVAAARYSRWRKAALDFFAEQTWGDAGVLPLPGSPPVLVRERELSVGLTWTERRWRRHLSLRVGADLDQDAFEADAPIAFTRPASAGPSVTLGLARTVGTPLGISAEDGGSATLRIRRRWRLDRPGWSNEWRARVAGYLALGGLGGFAHPVLAARGAGHWSAGPARETVGLGGTSSSGALLAPGLVLGTSRSFPVRGYAPSELRGTHVLAGALELRLPLALVARPLGDLPVGLDRLSLSLFTDHGWAEGPAQPSAWIHSAGAELVWDLGLSYDIPLRLRTGAAVAVSGGPRTPAGRIGWTVGVGSDF